MMGASTIAQDEMTPVGKRQVSEDCRPTTEVQRCRCLEPGRDDGENDG